MDEISASMLLPDIGTGVGPSPNDVNITIDAQIPLPDIGTGKPKTETETDDGVDPDAVLKAGILMSLVAICAILNHPLYTSATTIAIATTSIANKVHTLLSVTFYIAMLFNLLFGITQIVVSFLLHRFPQMIKMNEIGMVLMRATLGFGTALVLMTTSSSWLALYLLFISIRYK